MSINMRINQKFLQKKIKNLKKKCFLDIPTNNAVLLIGYPRSGTTWLSNIINFDNRYRYIFEPLREEVLLSENIGNFGYIRNHESNPEKKKFMDSLIKGRFKNSHCDRLGHRRIFSKRLIKFINANMLIGWLNKNFPYVPKVFIIRNPFAVICSKIRTITNHDWRWPTPSIDKYDQENLIEDYLKDYYPKLLNLESLFEKSFASWCIENYIAMKQGYGSDVLCVYYEHVLTDIESQVERIMKYLGIEKDNRIFEAVKIPSETAIDIKKPLVRWKELLTKEEIEKGMQLIKLFGMEKIYTDKVMPHANDWVAL
jgi:hypothetical protein